MYQQSQPFSYAAESESPMSDTLLANEHLAHERHPQCLPNWQPSMVQSQMRPLRLGEAFDLTPLEQSYCHHYGVDFEKRLDFIRHHFGYIDTENDFRIAVHTFEPEYRDEGTVLIVHGLYDHAGLYDAMIEYYLNKGMNVVVYDLPGHGLSSGDRAAISDFKEYVTVFDRMVKLCQDAFPGDLHVLGQSTGCSIIMDYVLGRALTKESTPFQSMVFFAPLIRPRAWKWGQASYVLLSPFLRRIKRRYNRNSSNENFLNFVRCYDPLQPQVLSVTWVGALKRWIKRIENMPPVALEPVVIQGHLDSTVDWQYNVTRLTKLFHHPVVHFLPDAGHQVANESDYVLDRVKERIDHLYDD